MAVLILLNKPFQTLCQFSDDQGRQTLSNFVTLHDVYPAGRLDYDSEGLVLLTDDGRLQHRIASPKQKTTKTYLVQVEGNIDEQALEKLRHGLELKDGPTRPASARRIDPPPLWVRTPPVRERANIPTSWIELKLTEGRNRQVRRMTAATGFPTLRLVRWQIGEWSLEGILPGEWRRQDIHLPTAPRTSKHPSPPGKHRHRARSARRQTR